MATGATFARLETLAQPKPVPPGFLEDRRSVYWIDRYPLKPGPDGTTVFNLTARQQQLCQHKEVNGYYKGDRPTPMWPVSNAARNASASGRIESLATARPVNGSYIYERSVYTEISPSAMSAQPSARMESLSQPKPHKIWATSTDTYREGEFSEPIWDIPRPALTANPTPRVEQLAEAKYPVPQYLGERPVQWPVSDTAKNTTATIRLQRLARPKSGKMVVDDYDPYKVTGGAKSARATPRVLELSAPIPRKMRAKKV